MTTELSSSAGAPACGCDAVEGVMPYKGMSETEGVKRLLILLLLKIGTPSKEIGMALDIHSSIIRRMFPGKTIKKLKNLQ